MRSQVANKIIESVRNKPAPYILKIMDFELQIDEGVYPPIGESIFLADNLKNSDYKIKRGESVLDYGCGSGFQSLVCASLGGIVIATDINPLAVNCACKNIIRNNFEDKVRVRQGKNLEPLLER